MYTISLVIVLLLIFYPVLAMAFIILNGVSQWYALEYANQCLIYITNMSTVYLSHFILTVITILLYVFLLNTESISFLLGTFSTSIYIRKKTWKNYCYNSENTMTKIIVSNIRNINEALIHGHKIRIYCLLSSWLWLIRDKKMSKIHHDNQRYSMYVSRWDKVARKRQFNSIQMNPVIREETC